MKRKLILFTLTLFALLRVGEAAAQHTLGFTAGYGLSTARLKPEEEMKGLWDSYAVGLTWRHYSRSRIVGGFGIDLEFMNRGFSYAKNSHYTDDPSEYLYYTRHVKSIVMPVVWQPHFYMLHNRLRFYLEAAATFSYNLSSTYENEYARDIDKRPDWKGDYHFRLTRDNRWGYGLAGGAGLAFLIKRYEINIRARYYFGFSDIVRNRSKYNDNLNDNSSENPFRLTPLKSPLDNFIISIGVSYRFNKAGFDEWKPRRKREKNTEVFKYAL